MKSFPQNILGCCVLLISALIVCGARAADEISLVSTSAVPSSSHDTNLQLFSIQAGPYHPQALSISNGTYTFNYQNGSLNSFVVETGWAARLFSFLGSIYLEENVGLSRFNGTGNTAPDGSASTLSVNLLSFDSRIMHSVDILPWKFLIPFWDVGYAYSFYFQSGSSDLDSVVGGVGNAVAGAGLRFWLNPGSSTAKDSVNRWARTPIFITAKFDHIFSAHQGGVDLGASVFLAGLSMGL